MYDAYEHNKITVIYKVWRINKETNEEMILYFGWVFEEIHYYIKSYKFAYAFAK